VLSRYCFISIPLLCDSRTAPASRYLHEWLLPGSTSAHHYLVVTVVTILANAWAAVADLAHAKFILANMNEVGVPRSWLPALGTLKLAGAVGLLLGPLGTPFIGVAATNGLVLFFTGALVTHLRARVFYNLAFPSGYWLLAIASLVLAVTQ
jgi:DoxX-like family